MRDISSSGDGLLPEHQSAKNINTTNPAGYNPSPEEQKTIRLVDQLYTKAKQHKGKYDLKWLDYYKFFRGKQWREQRPSYRHSEVINLVFQSIQSTVPIETDSRPKISYLPTSPMDLELSEILNKVCDSDWERKNWLYNLTEICYERNFYGAAFGSMEVEPNENGVMSIAFRSKDPFYVYPDPAAFDVNEKCKYFLYVEPVDVEILKKDYPDKAQYIKPDVIDMNYGDKTDVNKIRYKSPVDNRTLLDQTANYDVADRSQALKITCYIGPDNYEQEDNQDDAYPITDMGSQTASGSDSTPNMNNMPPLEAKKCPNGRKIVMACGVLLFDGENPYEDKKYPFARLTNYILPREFWGISDVEQLQGPNRIYNKILSFTLDVLTLMGNPIWVVDNTSGIDTDNLFNRPGLVVEKEPGTEVRREAGTELQGYVLPLLDRIRAAFDGVSGSHEISQGVEPKEVTAAAAIEDLQEAAQTRLRLKARHMDSFIQQIGQMYLSRVFQFYSVPQIVRITENEDASKYFKFHIDTQLDAEGNPVLNEFGEPVRVAKVRDFIQDPNTGVVSESPDVRSYEIHGKFDVKVSTGSSLPFAKNERLDKSLKLYDRGIVDAEEVLKAADYPNWEAVVGRLKSQQPVAKAAESK